MLRCVARLFAWIGRRHEGTPITSLLQVLTQAQPLQREVLPCMYLADHEPESVVITIY